MSFWNFYNRHIFPLVLEWTLDRPEIASLRKKLLSQAKGRTLELGLGTGLNLAHYPKSFRMITATDLQSTAHRRALQRAQESSLELDYHVLKSQRLPFSKNSFDTIVSTFTLCSVDSVPQVLDEVRRVLKPSGRFLFLEHGVSPDPNIACWQHRMDPFQIKLGGGSHHLTHNIPELLQEAGFSSVKSEGFYFEKFPKVGGFFYWGSASF